jgi:hypothetical protein
MVGTVFRLFGIESERLELLAPFSWQIAEPLDADAAGQATFYSSGESLVASSLVAFLMRP